MFLPKNLKPLVFYSRPLRHAAGASMQSTSDARHEDASFRSKASNTFQGLKSNVSAFNSLRELPKPDLDWIVQLLNILYM
jgi:hypothetical protein